MSRGDRGYQAVKLNIARTAELSKMIEKLPKATDRDYQVLDRANDRRTNNHPGRS